MFLQGTANGGIKAYLFATGDLKVGGVLALPNLRLAPVGQLIQYRVLLADLQRVASSFPLARRSSL